MFESKEPVGSGCVAQVYRGWARADKVDDPAFQTLMEEMDKDDLLEAWEIPGLRGVTNALWKVWSGKREEEKSETMWQEEHRDTEKESLIPVAIKVSGNLSLCILLPVLQRFFRVRSGAMNKFVPSVPFSLLPNFSQSHYNKH